MGSIVARRALAMWTLATPLLVTTMALLAVSPARAPGRGVEGAIVRITASPRMSAESGAPAAKIAIRVKKPGEGAAPAPPATASSVSADDAKVSIKVKGPKAPAAPPAPVAPTRSPEDERLFQATQSANCTLLLEALLDGANPNLRDPNGRTGLHFMAGVGLAPACVLLVHFGADVNARDNSGLVPLHMAAGYANAQCLRVLLTAGADHTIVGDQGTALDVVERLGEYQLNEFLNRTGVEKITKKKDEKLEALKACAIALMEPEKVREEENWDDMLKDVLRLVAL